MKEIYLTKGQQIFWCPRYGSFTTENGEHRQVESTILARLVRDTEGRANLTINFQSRIIPGYLWDRILETVGRL